MERHHNIQPFFLREVLIGSIFAYRTFLKKGYRSVQKIIVSMNKSTHRLSLHEKSLKNTRLLKLFKKTKFVKKLDFIQLLSKSKDVSLPVFLYITKKMATVSSLSINDPRGPEQSKSQGMITAWPKYSKYLKSLVYHVLMELSDDSKLMTENIKYLPRLKIAQIIFSSDYLKKIWQFKRYPASIHKMSLRSVNYCGDQVINVNPLVVSALKNLKAFEVNQNYCELTKCGIGLVCQLTQLQEFKIAFPEDFDISDVVCESMRKLSELRKVKFELLSKDSRNNFQILKSLEGCNLKYLNLRTTIKDKEDIAILIELLRKKKDSLETLKIRLRKLELSGGLERFEEFNQLFENIDDLPQLTNFAFSIDLHKMLLGRTYELIEVKIALNKIFSKSISLKRLRLSFNTFSFAEDSFLTLFESLRRVASNLEKLEIDFWGCYLKDRIRADDAIDFIRSLENIRSFKFYDLFGTSEAFFLKLVEAIAGLKYLRTLWIGRISEKIDRPSFDGCLQKILSKPGLETFICLSSGDFETTKRKEGEIGLSIKEIKRKNPYFKKAQVEKISVLDDQNPWNDEETMN